MTATIVDDRWTRSVNDLPQPAGPGVDRADLVVHRIEGPEALVLDGRAQHRPRRRAAHRFHAARSRRFRGRPRRRAPLHLQW
jgi:hypothetical protein